VIGNSEKSDNTKSINTPASLPTKDVGIFQKLETLPETLKTSQQMASVNKFQVVTIYNRSGKA
jgi:hypothetical protein